MTRKRVIDPSVALASVRARGSAAFDSGLPSSGTRMVLVVMLVRSTSMLTLGTSKQADRAAGRPHSNGRTATSEVTREGVRRDCLVGHVQTSRVHVPAQAGSVDVE